MTGRCHESSGRVLVCEGCRSAEDDHDREPRTLGCLALVSSSVDAVGNATHMNMPLKSSGSVSWSVHTASLEESTECHVCESGPHLSMASLA